MSNKGFTLVEILIVVIILGILAAIVIPQFTEASNEARDSAVVTDLQTLRSQIELYKIQHLQRYPGDDNSDGAEDAAGAFVSDLLSATNQKGTTDSSDGALVFGPYLQKFPINPFVDDNKNAVATDDITDANNMPAGDGDPGWFFNYGTGHFMANDDMETTGDVRHDQL